MLHSIQTSREYIIFQHSNHKIVIFKSLYFERKPYAFPSSFFHYQQSFPLNVNLAPPTKLFLTNIGFGPTTILTKIGACQSLYSVKIDLKNKSILSWMSLALYMSFYMFWCFKKINFVQQSFKTLKVGYVWLKLYLPYWGNNKAIRLIRHHFLITIIRYRKVCWVWMSPKKTKLWFEEPSISSVSKLLWHL